MSKSIFEILNAFMAGQIAAMSAKDALLGHFQMEASEKRQAMTQQYIDEILAELKAGGVTIEHASEGLEESAIASHASKKTTQD